MTITMLSKTARGLLAAMWMLLSGLAAADVVTMQNGDRLTGTVSSVSGGSLVLTTEYAGAVVIDLGQVANVVTEGEFDINAGGQKQTGKFAVQDDAQVLQVGDAAAPLDLATVTRADVNKLALTSFASEWNSRLDLSAVVSSGNSDTQALNTYLESILKNDNVEHIVTLLISNEEAEEQTTKDSVDLDYGYKRFLSEKWFASGNGEYFQDRIANIDQRITLGAGLGYQFWNNSLGAFSTDLGISVVREELAEENETNPAIRWGLDYRRLLLGERMEVFHKQSILFIPDSDRGEVLSSSSGARYALNTWLDTTARVDVNHQTEPQPGNSKTDVTYSLGIGFKF